MRKDSHLSSSKDGHVQGGRTNQKQRTRFALLQGARDLMDRGEVVTVVAAAKQARISTATAYRYFSDADTLASEAVLDLDLARSVDLTGEFILALEGVAKLEDRVMIVHRLLFDFTRRMEMPYRLYLAKVQEAYVKAAGKPKGIARGGRRITMFELALKPFEDQFSEADLADLVAGLSSVSGIEGFIVLKDVCRLSDAEIERVAEKNVRALLSAALRN